MAGSKRDLKVLRVWLVGVVEFHTSHVGARGSPKCATSCR